MSVTISLPDDILAGNTNEVSRKVLEQVALDGFRSGQISAAQVARILGLESRLQAFEFLASHDVPWVDYDADELQREVDVLRKIVP